MRLEIDHRIGDRFGRWLTGELGIGLAWGVDVWVAEMPIALRRAVELVGRDQVAQLVATVVSEEQLARQRMPVEPDRIAHAASEHLELVAVRAQPHDRAFEAPHLADVARRADGDVQPPVGAEAGIPPAVVAKVREHARRHHDLALPGAIEAADLVLLDHEQRAIGGERQAVGHLEPARELDHLVGEAIALRIADGEHLVAPRPDVDAAPLLGDDQRARPGHFGKDLDRKSGRCAQPTQRQLRTARRRQQRNRQNDADREFREGGRT